MAMVHAPDIDRLEQTLDAFNENLPPLKDFILPGGGMAAAQCHLARTICRRAEREVVTLARHDAVRPEAVRYLNRLSDLLWTMIVATTGSSACNSAKRRTETRRSTVWSSE